MRTLLIKILLRLILSKEYVKPISKNEVDSILIRLANEEGLERFPLFLDQCAAQYKNQFMLSIDPVFRGTVLAFVSLKERILEKKGKNLTKDKKSGIIKTSY